MVVADTSTSRSVVLLYKSPHQNLTSLAFGGVIKAPTSAIAFCRPV